MASPDSYTREDYLDGQILRIDKPLDWTSFQAVNAVKWALRRGLDIQKIKVGHAGTLDPLATGLLLICTGKATHRIPELQLGEKTYTGTIHMGATRPSFDRETPIDATFAYDHLTEQDFLQASASLTGVIMQRPPVYSAIRKGGQRMYDLARKGQDVEMQPRPVEIFEFSITGISGPRIQFLVRCSKGTYIRSLAHDFGQLLGSGAYLEELRRIRIGDFSVDNAETPDEFKERFLNPER